MEAASETLEESLRPRLRVEVRVGRVSDGLVNDGLEVAAAPAALAFFGGMAVPVVLLEVKQ